MLGWTGWFGVVMVLVPVLLFLYVGKDMYKEKYEEEESKLGNALKHAIKIYGTASFYYAKDGSRSSRRAYNHAWALIAALHGGTIPGEVLQEMREIHRGQTEGGLKHMFHIALPNKISPGIRHEIWKDLGISLDPCGVSGGHHPLVGIYMDGLNGCCG